MNRRRNVATDPVCKMEVEPAKAAAKADYAGQVYYFCSDTCHKAFVAEPKEVHKRCITGRSLVLRWA